MNQPLNALDKIPPYCIVQDFLGDELIERLLAHASAKQAEFKPSKIGKQGGHLD